MGGKCSMHVRDERCMQNFRERPSGKSRNRWENIIKMDFEEM
jgi:hypothetical protein